MDSWALISVILFMVGAGLGAGIFFVIKRYQDEEKKKSARHEAERILNKAKSDAAKIDRDSKNKAKDFETRARKNVESDIQKQKNQLKSQETRNDRRLKEIEDQFKLKNEDFEKSAAELRSRDEKLNIAENRHREIEKKLESQLEEVRNKLASVGSLTLEEAKKELFRSMEDEARAKSLSKILQIEEEAKQEAEKKVKRLISTALSRYAAEYTAERTVSVLALPSDEMKGKIIGREGRNIRTLEALCGVDVIVDDTPESVVISGFDPVRREVAKRTLEKLMEDGRVHPARIEEVVDKVRSDLLKLMKEDGEKACLDLGIPTVHPELLKLLGSLKYRSTHTQNCYNHSLEVGHLAGLMAAELGANVKVAKRAGLLHDIGKAVDHQAEGNHAQAGSEIAKKYGENEVVCLAIRYHEDGGDRHNSLISYVVEAANLIANARPGSRRPNMDSFIQRLEDLESIGNSFDGVIRTFAVQAGREVRVIVESSKVTDEQSIMLGRDIARKIERELSFSSPIKVNVVRETRAVEMAR